MFRAGGAAYVSNFNGFLPGLAANEGVPFVDVFKAFNGDVTTLIDTDGLHPTAAGYTVIAQTFFNSIKQNLELAATANSTSLTAPVTPPLTRPLTTPFVALPRRR
jgi:lysophospholipase L1-like esterase